MKIALGTAQFGLDYGISNDAGKVDFDTVNRILKFASENDIDTIDTAAAYGDAESVLGNAKGGTNNFNIITKISSGTYSDEIKLNLIGSLKRLKRSTVYGVLLHDVKDLSKKSIDQLVASRNEGQVKKIGVSIYNHHDVAEVLKYDSIDLVQLPIHLFDQHFFRKGILDRLKEKNIEIHARSVFCQGLYFLDEDKLPDYFLPVKKSLKLLKSECKNVHYSLLDVLLGYVNSLPQIDKIVIGVTSDLELSDICRAIRKTINFDYTNYDQNLSDLMNPRNWPA